MAGLCWQHAPVHMWFPCCPFFEHVWLITTTFWTHCPRHLTKCLHELKCKWIEYFLGDTEVVRSNLSRVRWATDVGYNTEVFTLSFCLTQKHDAQAAPHGNPRRILQVRSKHPQVIKKNLRYLNVQPQLRAIEVHAGNTSLNTVMLSLSMYSVASKVLTAINSKRYLLHHNHVLMYVIQKWCFHVEVLILATGIHYDISILLYYTFIISEMLPIQIWIIFPLLSHS
jgi:hypothetical protein